MYIKILCVPWTVEIRRSIREIVVARNAVGERAVRSMYLYCISIIIILYAVCQLYELRVLCKYESRSLGGIRGLHSEFKILNHQRERHRSNCVFAIYVSGDALIRP